jgi:hypothetical protein
MTERKFQHTKPTMTVQWSEMSESYISGRYIFPKEIIENSEEWEEVLPVYDFLGNEVDVKSAHYTVFLYSTGGTTISNTIGGHTLPDAKVLAIFKEYGEAQAYQRIYVALRKSTELLITPTGLPSAYLKKVLKTISETENK